MVDSHDHDGVDRRSVLRTIGAGTLAVSGTIGASGLSAADASSSHYHNPVGPVGFGDVSVVQADDGTYYVYGTETPEDIIPIATSENLANWGYIGQALQSYPDWRNDDAGVWAPDVNRYNGQYHLYYSYSVFGSNDNPGIGLATADTPEGPFTDQGPVFRENDLGMTNAIDAEFRVVNGTPYLVWGSFYGLYGVELTPDGTDYVPGTTFHLAGDDREGGMIVEENGYYYLFYSTGYCCKGYDSTYEVEVGRSDSFFGPYYNQNGTDLRDLNELRSGISVLNGTDYFTGPGHNTAIQDEYGDWWMLYHVEATTDQEVRQMMIDRIQWVNDWPVVACDGTPSTRSPMPNTGSYDCNDVNSSIGISEGTYQVTNVNSGKLLEVSGAGTADGDNVQQWSDNGGDHQHWAVTENGDGTFHFRNVNSGKLLEVANAGTSDGDNVRQYADTGHPCQDWHVIDNGDGTYRIENANSSRVADVYGASTTDGANVVQWTWNGGANQRWTLTRV